MKPLQLHRPVSALNPTRPGRGFGQRLARHTVALASAAVATLALLGGNAAHATISDEIYFMPQVQTQTPAPKAEPLGQGEAVFGQVVAGPMNAGEAVTLSSSTGMSDAELTREVVLQDLRQAREDGTLSRHGEAGIDETVITARDAANERMATEIRWALVQEQMRQQALLLEQQINEALALMAYADAESGAALLPQNGEVTVELLGLPGTPEGGQSVEPIVLVVVPVGTSEANRDSEVNGMAWSRIAAEQARRTLVASGIAPSQIVVEAAPVA
jgi:hypothetical protein